MKVSVAMITYNHEEYIAKAIDSVLMQRTNFDYEIVIGEDCSTDSTRDIVTDYQKRYPDKFRLLLNEKNLGPFRNAKQTYESCQGTYVAVLDGDDYWTSPEKLQKQVDFLDNHPECAICFHDSLILHEDGSVEPTSYRPSQKEFSTVEDLLLDNYIPTASVMFRRGLFGGVPDWVGTLKMGDWPIHILNALHGKIGFIDQTMAVYVVHRGGVWSTKGWQDHALAIIDLFEALGRHLEPKYSRLISRILRWRYFTVSERYENIDDLTNARTYAIKSLTKHFMIINEPFRYGNMGDSNLVNSLPNYIKSVRSARLFKSMLRLYVVPILRSNTPTLYKFLRAIVRQLNMGL